MTSPSKVSDSEPAETASQESDNIQTAFRRTRASVDAKLNEIPEGRYRVKLLATIVSVQSGSIVISDGTGTAVLGLSSNFSGTSDFEVSTLGRFIADVVNTDGHFTGNLIGWQQFPSELVDKYEKLIKIERRIPK